MAKLDILKNLFHLAVVSIGGTLGQKISNAETIATDTGATKAEKVVSEIANGVGILNALVPTLSTHPKYIAAVKRLNDELVRTANVVVEIASEATAPEAGSGGNGGFDVGG